MKKVMLFLLLGILVLAIAACNKQKAQEPAQADTVNQPAADTQVDTKTEPVAEETPTPAATTTTTKPKPTTTNNTTVNKPTTPEQPDTSALDAVIATYENFVKKYEAKKPLPKDMPTIAAKIKEMQKTATDGKITPAQKAKLDDLIKRLEKVA